MFSLSHATGHAICIASAVLYYVFLPLKERILVSPHWKENAVEEEHVDRRASWKENTLEGERTRRSTHGRRTHWKERATWKPIPAQPHRFRDARAPSPGIAPIWVAHFRNPFHLNNACVLNNASVGRSYYDRLIHSTATGPTSSGSRQSWPPGQRSRPHLWLPQRRRRMNWEGACGARSGTLRCAGTSSSPTSGSWMNWMVGWMMMMILMMMMNDDDDEWWMIDNWWRIMDDGWWMINDGWWRCDWWWWWAVVTVGLGFGGHLPSK